MMLQPRVIRAHHTGLTVLSIDRSLEFYRDLLGFEVLFRWNPRAPYIAELVGYPTVDLHAAILRIPDSEVFLELVEYRNISESPVDPMNGKAGTAHVAFLVDKLDDLFANLESRGVSFVSRPVTPTIGPNKGGRAVYLLDPDDIRVELIETSGSFQTYKPTAKDFLVEGFG